MNNIDEIQRMTKEIEVAMTLRSVFFVLTIVSGILTVILIVRDLKKYGKIKLFNYWNYYYDENGKFLFKEKCQESEKHA